MNAFRGVLPLRGLRARITVLATGLSAVVSLLLLWLAWTLVGDAVSGVPQLPPGTIVRVDGVDVDALALAEHLRQHARDKVLIIGSIAFFLVVLATAVLSWTLTSRVLRPLREITETARRLSVESMGERMGDLSSKDELAELGKTFNAMLDRLQIAFEAQQQFVANASHELRTPLAVIRTELDVTLADEAADEAELRRMAVVIRDATERAGRLVSSLLLLARTDSAGLMVTEPMDFAFALGFAWEAIEPEATQKELKTSFRTMPAWVRGDPALLERVAGNLLENAVRHNVPGGWLVVTTGVEKSWAVLKVSSSGGVIDPRVVPTLFEPFRRAGVARIARSGAGLGLSIVRAVVLAHGGTVEAEAVPEGGLSVSVRLPILPVSPSTDTV